MARSRNIKPSFFTNEYLSELNPLARLLFIGLWCHADREGRLEDRPKRLKVDILPYDNCDVDKLLNMLNDSPDKFIIRYEVDGSKYIQIVNFHKHQNPHIKEQASIIPEPDINIILLDKHHVSTILEPDKNSSCPADSLNPITDSFKLYSSSSKGNIFQFYQQNIGLLSPYQAELIGSYLDDGLTEELITEAIKDSLGADNKWTYLQSILKNCIDANITTADQYAAKKLEKQQRQQKPKKKTVDMEKIHRELEEEGEHPE